MMAVVIAEAKANEKLPERGYARIKPRAD